MGAFLALALSPIGRFLITGAVMFSLGGVVGFRAEKAFSDARWFKAVAAAKDKTIATLTARIKVVNQASTEDQSRAATAERLRVEAETRAKNAEARIAKTPAFDAADTDGLRHLWRPQARGAAKR